MEHRFYAKIVTDITTRNSERKDTLDNIICEHCFYHSGVNAALGLWELDCQECENIYTIFRPSYPNTFVL
jgi:hypothetical protein